MRHALAWLAWAAPLFWLWLLLAGEWNRTELVAAALAAAIAGGVAEVGRARLGLHARVGGRELAAARGVPLAIVVDFGILAAVLVQSLVRRRVVRGVFRSHELDAGGSDAAGVGRRAWLEYAATISANAYVVEIERERGLVLLHDLVPRRASEKPA
ncbi:MAG TPA: hypothetical protein VFJ91_12015 [Gaiellaceae bacterium]|nr:hypothetical protein [Gaiellaceae bacterium]